MRPRQRFDSMQRQKFPPKIAMVQYSPMNPHFISKPNLCEDKILTINFKVGVISLSHSGFFEFARVRVNSSLSLSLFSLTKLTFYHLLIQSL